MMRPGLWFGMLLLIMIGCVGFIFQGCHSESTKKFRVSKEEFFAAFADLPKLYTQISIVPHFKDDIIHGMKVMSVKKNTIFMRMGLKRGDVWTKFNSRIVSLRDYQTIFDDYKMGDDFTLEIERGGTVQVIKVVIK